MLTEQLVSLWLKRILGHEGGYWNDPVGGPTKWGISQRTYPELDIPSLTADDAARIYRRDFLAPLRAVHMDDGTAFQLLDFGVNSGMQTAIKQMQKILKIKADGIIGQQTRLAVLNVSESDMIMLIIAARLRYMSKLRNLRENCRGWMERLARNLEYGAEDSE